MADPATEALEFCFELEKQLREIHAHVVWRAAPKRDNGRFLVIGQRRRIPFSFVIFAQAKAPLRGSSVSEWISVECDGDDYKSEPNKERWLKDIVAPVVARLDRR